MSHDALLRLEGLLETFGEVAVAVSGGVDSLTLATVAHRRLGQRAAMLHAVSPAVPAEAARRTREPAEAQDWGVRGAEGGGVQGPGHPPHPGNPCVSWKAQPSRPDAPPT